MSAITISLQAPDISCGHCVKSVETRLGGLEGIERANASAETKIIEITFNADAISLDKIKAELEDEGYPAAEIN